MDSKEYRAMETSEIGGKIVALKQELFHLRCQLAMGRMENPMRVRQVRREVARAKTILQEKEQSLG